MVPRRLCSVRDGWRSSPLSPGHNGAGKTTFSSILCCETGASDGDATIFGYSVSQNPSAVRNLVGVCKQDDYLYPNLSAREHLELFAGLRGVASKDLAEIVQKWLESVDLGLVDGLYTAGFSGGMKRRLSVACATIGGRPFIVLGKFTVSFSI
jgi:ABC-type multidrug transport system ATPase subunit